MTTTKVAVELVFRTGDRVRMREVSHNEASRVLDLMSDPTFQPRTAWLIGQRILDNPLDGERYQTLVVNVDDLAAAGFDEGEDDPHAGLDATEAPKNATASPGAG